MSQFRLLDLPYIPQRLILGQMDLMEILDLSLMFEILKQPARGLMLRATNCEFKISNFAQYAATIKIRDRNDKEVKISFRTDRVSRKATIRKVDGMEMQVDKSGKMFKFKEGKNNKENCVIFGHVLQHLMFILRIEYTFVSSAQGVFETPIFNHNMNLKRLILHNQDITPNQAKLLFENSGIREVDFRYTSVAGTNGPQIFALNNEFIHLERCDWLDFDSIPTMNCAELSIGNGNKYHLHLEHLINIVRKWCDGGLPEMRKITILGIGNKEQRMFDIIKKWEDIKLSKSKLEQYIQRSDEKCARISTRGEFILSVVD